MFDDVELTAADIARLAREARPLIRSGGRWVALDRADLQAAADALAERADTTQLSGAETLRLALGIEGSPLAGGVSVVGGGWAAELLAAAADVSSVPAGTPAGFVGELRSYQAEALAWLGFLGKAGLGGCLALDMGLGKTPTMLADLLAGAGSGPALVIAPPAVVGNWTAEAARFTPGLRVVVHHGANRAAADEIAAEVADADVVVTTYGTAVRDIDAIAEVSWSKVILDEAQAIKNPANDTSQQLRRIPARRGSRSPARRSRTVSATSGRSSTSRTPGSSVRGRSSSPGSRATAAPRASRPKTRCARSTASSCSGARRPSPRSRRSFPTRSTSSTVAR